MGSNEACDLENGIVNDSSNEPKPIKTAHSLSSSLLRKKSDVVLGLNIRSSLARRILRNLQEVIFGTRICILFLAIPLSIVAKYQNFGRVSTISLVDVRQKFGLCKRQPVFLYNFTAISDRFLC